MKLEGKPGKYFLRAYLAHGGSPAAYEKEFFISAKPTEQMNLTIGALGVPQEAIDFLTTQGITVTGDLESVDTILIGDIAADGAVGENAKPKSWDPTINFHKPRAAQTAANGTRLMELCEKGKHLIFGESFYLHNHDDDHPCELISFFGMPDLDIFLTPDWLYHMDNAFLPHKFTAGIKEGFLDWDWFWGCQPIDAIVTECEADVAAAFFYVGGPIWCKPYNEMLAGPQIATFPRGKGSFTLTALPLLQNTGSCPAGDRILLNMIRG